jgi:hypothetical protein
MAAVVLVVAAPVPTLLVRFRLTNHMVGGVAGGLGLMVAISGRTTPLALVR